MFSWVTCQFQEYLVSVDSFNELYRHFCYIINDNTIVYNVHNVYIYVHISILYYNVLYFTKQLISVPLYS